MTSMGSNRAFFVESLTIDPVVDTELKTVEAVLELLSALSYPARIRVLNYIGARLNPDNS